MLNLLPFVGIPSAWGGGEVPWLSQVQTRFAEGTRIALITLGTDRINSVERWSGITPWARAFFIWQPGGIGVYSVWKAVPTGTAWAVWREERNERVEEVGGGNRSRRTEKFDAL